MPPATLQEGHRALVTDLLTVGYHSGGWMRRHLPHMFGCTLPMRTRPPMLHRHPLVGFQKAHTPVCSTTKWGRIETEFQKVKSVNSPMALHTFWTYSFSPMTFSELSVITKLSQNNGLVMCNSYLSVGKTVFSLGLPSL